MVETRSKAEVVPNSSSDSEAPEQVTLSSGREKAQQLRKEERENQKRVQAEAKQRRQRHLKKEEAVPLDKQEEAPVADTLEDTSANPAQNEQDEQEFLKSAKISGFLDTSVIDFLAAQEKKGAEVSTSTPEDKNPRMRNRTGKRKRSKDIISSGRVKVVLLQGDQSSSANYQSALEFKNKRLFGEGVPRSLKMLPKPTSA